MLLVIKMWRTIKMEDKKTMIKMEALRRIIEAIVSILPPVLILAELVRKHTCRNISEAETKELG